MLRSTTYYRGENTSAVKEHGRVRGRHPEEATSRLADGKGPELEAFVGIEEWYEASVGLRCRSSTN